MKLTNKSFSKPKRSELLVFSRGSVVRENHAGKISSGQTSSIPINAGQRRYQSRPFSYRKIAIHRKLMIKRIRTVEANSLSNTARGKSKNLRIQERGASV